MKHNIYIVIVISVAILIFTGISLKVKERWGFIRFKKIFNLAVQSDDLTHDLQFCEIGSGQTNICDMARLEYFGGREIVDFHGVQLSVPLPKNADSMRKRKSSHSASFIINDDIYNAIIIFDTVLDDLEDSVASIINSGIVEKYGRLKRQLDKYSQTGQFSMVTNALKSSYSDYREANNFEEKLFQYLMLVFKNEMMLDLDKISKMYCFEGEDYQCCFTEPYRIIVDFQSSSENPREERYKNIQSFYSPKDGSKVFHIIFRYKENLDDDIAIKRMLMFLEESRFVVPEDSGGHNDVYPLPS